VKQIPVPLGGLRGKHDGIKTGALDQTVRDYFTADPRYVPIQAAESRPNTRWIDWFGNLEVSPPVPGFPHGRVLTGFQKELRFHPDLIAFLEAQKLQCPPLYLDVSWLTIGHVDELINFVPARDRKGFRALLPSPSLAKTVLEDAIKNGHGKVPVFAGTKQETTVAKLFNDVADTVETRAIETSLTETRKQLAAELKLEEGDIVRLPVLFKGGLAMIPNGVNSLVIGKDILIPAPNGPRIDGNDLLEKAIRERLAPLGLRLHFLDIHEPYHVRSGEIHCGTNAARRLKNPRWWDRG
jgi:protein-arginine deiminase